MCVIINKKKSNESTFTSRLYESFLLVVCAMDSFHVESEIYDRPSELKDIYISTMILNQARARVCECDTRDQLLGEKVDVVSDYNRGEIAGRHSCMELKQPIVLMYECRCTQNIALRYIVHWLGLKQVPEQ